MTSASELIDRHFGRRDGELLIGGVPVGEIARRFGTPLFVYDQGVMTDTLRRLRRALPAPMEIYYSIKANPNQALLGFFVAQGCGLEVASAGELHQALAAGCDPERTLFAGPGKTEAELDQAVSRGIGEIHVESFREIEALDAVAGRHGQVVRVALRINPAGEAQGGAMRMGGKPSPFGFDEELLDEAVDRVTAARALRFSGIHVYLGTQILDHGVLVRQYGHAVELARRATIRAGRPLHTIDFGGGLGIPYYPGDGELDVEALGRELRPLVEQWTQHPELQGTRLIVEPGRFLVGPCGVYVTRVTEVKRSRGKTFVVIDGGMHHHLAASGNLGQVIKKNYPVAVLNRLEKEADGPVDVVGPLCTPLDCLARAVELPSVEPGDLIGVLQSGAYAYSASPLGFLSHPTPPEVLAGEGQAWSIRPRGSLDQFLEAQARK